MTVLDLNDLYRAEGINIGAGRSIDLESPRNLAFRHVLRGGRGLFTPLPDSLGYKRLMYTEAPTYRPRSEEVERMAERLRDGASTALAQESSR
jgi:hypothetical protein